MKKLASISLLVTILVLSFSSVMARGIEKVPRSEIKFTVNYDFAFESACVTPFVYSGSDFQMVNEIQVPSFHNDVPHMIAVIPVITEVSKGFVHMNDRPPTQLVFY